jgi:excinuclease ABC subunit B
MFELVSDYAPAGDQPQAIAKLTEGMLVGRETSGAARRHGFGQDVHDRQRDQEREPAHAGHLAQQDARGAALRGVQKFFPNNAVEYFVSYFDYYQPEAYIPRTDTFIEKDSSINEEIERMRLSTMSSLFARRDVIVVASVSCIYGTGSKEDYEQMVIPVRSGRRCRANSFSARLVELQYNRNDITFERGQFPRARRHD